MRKRRPVRVVLGLILLALFAICFMRFAFSGQNRAPAPAAEPTPASFEAKPQPETVPEPENAEPTDSPTQESAEPAKISVPAGLPVIDVTDSLFMLVNGENPVGDYVPELDTLEGQKLDARIIEPMRSMIAAARAEGLSVYLASGYRTNADQQYLYNRKLGQGIVPEEAVKTVPAPGYCEHQTGLCCDVTDIYREVKDSSLAESATFRWLSGHCAQYGFIVRYPDGKSDVTGIDFSPWHFRYVGVEAAQYITEKGLCLEEFLALYK